MGEQSINDIKRKVQLPKESVELAEFFGALTGDGYMNNYRKYDYIIEITSNKIKDKEYLIYLSRLIKKLFNINPCYSEKKDQDTACLTIRSKFVFGYLLDKGFVRGKKEQISIPSWIENNEHFLKSFVRGLFDTDGCVSLKNKEGKKYPVLSITSKSEILLTRVKAYLEKRDISSYKAKRIEKGPRYLHEIITYKIEVNGHKNLNLWFELIGSSNERNLKRFKEAQDLKAKTKV